MELLRLVSGLAAWLSGAAGALAAPQAAPGGAEPRPAPGKVRVLALEQEAQGLPDYRPDAPVLQKLLIDLERDRVILLLHAQGAPATAPQAAAPGGPGAGASRPLPPVERRVILRMDYDPPEVIEVAEADRTYHRTRGDLNRIQEERDRQEQAELRHSKEMERAEREALLKENHLQPDGTRVVEVVRGEGRKDLGHGCEEVKVTENGRTVIRAQVTREVTGGRKFFHLYRRLGAFSRQVLERAAELEGLPLEAEIVVVTAGPVIRMSARFLSVGFEEIPDTAFDIPAGYQERKAELPAIVKCAAGCGKEIERNQAPARKFEDGNWYHFCSQACRKRWNEARDEERKKAGRAPPVRAPR